MKTEWVKPNKRAASYAAERKAKVHQHGPGRKRATDYEAGFVRDTYSARATMRLYKYKRHWTKANQGRSGGNFRKRAKREEREAAKAAKAEAKAERKLRKQKAATYSGENDAAE
ncbi:MAG: hypothetical protein ACLRSW_13235 [Christensenellaceae bacterium]